MNGNKPVILVSHSFGGYYALQFLYQTLPTWHRRFVKHFVLLSIGVGGGLLLLQVQTSDLSPAPSPRTC